MRVDKTWHKCFAGDINNRRVQRFDPRRGHRADLPILYKNIKSWLWARMAVEQEAGVLEEDIGIFHVALRRTSRKVIRETPPALPGRGVPRPAADRAVDPRHGTIGVRL